MSLTFNEESLGTTRRVYIAKRGDAQFANVAWDGEAWREDRDAQPFGVLPSSDDWTILRCVGTDWQTRQPRRGTKEWERDEASGQWVKRSYQAGSRFALRVERVASTVEAWSAFLRRQEAHAEEFLVRGILAREPEDGLVGRGLRAQAGAWLAPHPVGRRVLALDFDSVEPRAWWPGRTRWPTVEEGAQLVRETLEALPGRFWSAACVYRWSASVGIPGYVDPSSRIDHGPAGWSRPSFHVVLMLDREVADESLWRWLDGLGTVDPALCKTVQPWYTAAPLWRSPSPWPSGWPRVNVLDGAACVEAPAALVDGWTLQARRDEAERRQRQARHEADIERQRRAGRDDDAIRDEIKEEKAEALASVRSASVGTRFATFFKEATRLVQLVNGGALTHADLEDLLAAYVETKPSAAAEGRASLDEAIAREKTRRDWAVLHRKPNNGRPK